MQMNHSQGVAVFLSWKTLNNSVSVTLQLARDERRGDRYHGVALHSSLGVAMENNKPCSAARRAHARVYRQAKNNDVDEGSQ